MVGWRKLLQSDVRILEDLDDAKKKRVQLSKPSRSARGQEILKSKEGAASAGESRRLISWIWVAAESGDGFSTNEALFEGLRIEWCKAYARVRRRREEVELLNQEQRRCLVTLDWQAQQWEEQATMHWFEGAHAERVAAYAYQQAAVKRRMRA